MTHRFSISDEWGRNDIYDSSQSEINVGSGYTTDIVVKDSNVARNHGVFEVGENRVIYSDTSEYGSVVGGESIQGEEIEIREGVGVVVGKTTIVYQGEVEGGRSDDFHPVIKKIDRDGGDIEGVDGGDGDIAHLYEFGEDVFNPPMDDTAYMEVETSESLETSRQKLITQLKGITEASEAVPKGDISNEVREGRNTPQLGVKIPQNFFVWLSIALFPLYITCLWPFALIINIASLIVIHKIEKRTGEAPTGKGCLFVVLALPIIILIGWIAMIAVEG
jgi:FHA domain